jgi:hypothetical protein
MELTDVATLPELPTYAIHTPDNFRQVVCAAHSSGPFVLQMISYHYPGGQIKFGGIRADSKP